MNVDDASRVARLPAATDALWPILVQPAWMRDAACVAADPELFFPEDGGRPYAAVRVCDGCRVRDACLDYALDDLELDGVWGGTTRSQRLRMAQEAA